MSNLSMSVYRPSYGLLSEAVQHMLEALGSVHSELSVPRAPEHAAALRELATQLQEQICTLVKLLRPLPSAPDLGGGGPPKDLPPFLFAPRTE